MKNTAEKDRQTQILLADLEALDLRGNMEAGEVFALINVLMVPGWKDMDQIVKAMKSRGYDRCHRTIRRLFRVLKKVGVNVLVNRETTPYTYKISRTKPFV